MKKILTVLKPYFVPTKCVVAVGLITFLFSRFDIGAVLPYFERINFWLIVIFIMYVPSLIIGSTRWKLFLPAELSVRELFVTAWISNFFSNFLPSSIGGDSYKIIYLRKMIGTYVVAQSVLFDRLSGVLVILLVGLPAAYYFLPEKFGGYVFFLGLLLLGLGVGAGLVILWGSHLPPVLQPILAGLKLFRVKLVPATLLSLVYLLLGGTSLWIYYVMFGYNFSFVVVVGIYALVQLVELVPVSINSIGVREGMLVFLFTYLGVPGEISLAIALISRLVLVLQTSVGGILYLLRTRSTYGFK